MLELAKKVANGQKELNIETINQMIESNMDKAYNLLKTGYDKNKAWDLFFSILGNNKKLTNLVMDEAYARFQGKESWSMKNYIK